MDNSISFSKIAATPTLASWSQAYNAGKLFAVLSLEKTKDLPETESLNMLGKNLLERLEQEFFIIENKNLESIKEAVCATFENTTEGVAVSFAAGAFVDNVLYLFGFGNARVFVKRDGNLGLALNAENATSENVASSSGFIKEADLIVLATDAFSQTITQDDLVLSLIDAEPSEITETLAPKIHKAENGKISAIVIKYKNPHMEEVIDEGIETEDETKQEKQVGKQVSLFNKYLSLLKSRLRISSLRLKPTRKLFLSFAIIIVAVLISSVFLAVREQNNAKVRALFAQIYPQAQKKYDEGQSLTDLNKSFARESLLAAQKILNDNKDNFPLKSKESLQTQDLLKKIKEGLTQVSPIDKSGLDRGILSIAVQNGSGIEGTAGKAANILRDFGYNVVSTDNADNFNYQGVTVRVKKENANFLELLKKDLTKDYTVKSVLSDLPSTSPTNALIIIGK